MILGVSLSGPDNGGYMLSGAGGVPRCGVCGCALTHDWINPSYVLPGTTFDFSATYDGYSIVSERFRGVLGEENAVYRELPSQVGFFALYATRVVEFDVKRRQTSFEDFCNGCSRYRHVAGATPVFVVGDIPLPDVLVRTDVEFGSNDERHPLLLIGRGVAAGLRAAELSGLNLRPIEA